ncbi:hypothetical protein XAC2852_580221 [Xanthomonas citri pv. citri]|nr:hypothetical protein XAC2852_580221 [Xanthomonas citri pv. citri]
MSRSGSTGGRLWSLAARVSQRSLPSDLLHFRHALRSGSGGVLSCCRAVCPRAIVRRHRQLSKLAGKVRMIPRRHLQHARLAAQCRKLEMSDVARPATPTPFADWQRAASHRPRQRQRQAHKKAPSPLGVGERARCLRRSGITRSDQRCRGCGQRDRSGLLLANGRLLLGDLLHGRLLGSGLLGGGLLGRLLRYCLFGGLLDGFLGRLLGGSLLGRLLCSLLHCLLGGRLLGCLLRSLLYCLLGGCLLCRLLDGLLGSSLLYCLLGGRLFGDLLDCLLGGSLLHCLFGSGFLFRSFCSGHVIGSSSVNYGGETPS